MVTLGDFQVSRGHPRWRQVKFPTLWQGVKVVEIPIKGGNLFDHFPTDPSPPTGKSLF